MSLHSEQGTVSLAPFFGYPIKAKGVTTFVTPFAYLTVLRTPPQGEGTFVERPHIHTVLLIVV